MQSHITVGLVGALSRGAEHAGVQNLISIKLKHYVHIWKVTAQIFCFIYCRSPN